MSAAAPAVAPNSVPLRLNAAQCADVHGDELAACEPKRTVPFSVPLESVALAAWYPAANPMGVFIVVNGFGNRQPSRSFFLMFLMIFGDRQPSRFVFLMFVMFFW